MAVAASWRRVFCRGHSCAAAILPRACLGAGEPVWYLPMGKLKVRFRCVHCGHCCTDVVCLPTPWDVIQIVKATGEDPRDFLEFLTPEEISEVDADDPTWLECGDERRIMALRRGHKGCFFLDKKTKHCRIYEHRPILCRLYPFKLRETKSGKFDGFSLHKDVDCPRKRDGIVEAKPLYACYKEDCKHQEDYESLVEVFNRYEQDDPEDFLRLFIKGLR